MRPIFTPSTLACQIWQQQSKPKTMAAGTRTVSTTCWRKEIPKDKQPMLPSCACVAVIGGFWIWQDFPQGRQRRKSKKSEPWRYNLMGFEIIRSDSALILQGETLLTLCGWLHFCPVWHMEILEAVKHTSVLRRVMCHFDHFIPLSFFCATLKNE